MSFISLTGRPQFTGLKKSYWTFFFLFRSEPSAFVMYTGKKLTQLATESADNE